MKENIWYRDFGSFFKVQNLSKFLPSGDMTFVEKLNAIMRFSIYFSILVYFVKFNVLVFYFTVFVAFLTIFMYEFYAKNKNLQKELYNKMNLMYDDNYNTYCQLPTKDNPFMNVTMNEYNDFPNRPKACDISTKQVRDSAEKFFAKNLYRDVDDIWTRKSNSRNWHTTPSTTIPNDRDSFANWLYKLPPTCKESNGNACYNNLYHPYKM